MHSGEARTLEEILARNIARNIAIMRLLLGILLELLGIYWNITRCTGIY